MKIDFVPVEGISAEKLDEEFAKYEQYLERHYTLRHGAYALEVFDKHSLHYPEDPTKTFVCLRAVFEDGYVLDYSTPTAAHPWFGVNESFPAPKRCKHCGR